MKYALGNMLNGAGGLNADGLSLDLQFATDKTLTARKGPTPVFTRASTATFVGSNGLIQSAAINAARFDHDPVTLACKGLLIEESRTNICLQSNAFSTSPWGEIGGVCTMSQNVTGVDGVANSAWTLEDDNTTTTEGRSQAVNLTNATAYSLSVFIKKTTGTPTSFPAIYILLAFPSTIGGCVINTTTGATTSINSFFTATILSSTNIVSSFGNFWKVTTTVTANSTASWLARILPSFNGDGSGAWNVASTGSAVFWGAQLEAGSFATSYIPTVAASVVRSVDVCSITGSAFTGMYNASEGTMLVNAFTPANGDRTIFTADDNTANEMIRLRTESTNPFFKVTDNGVELVAIDSGAVVANTTFKLAGAYLLNDFASSVNGGAAVTDTSGTIPTVDRIRIGAGQSGNTMCGCISSLRYYKKRLANAKLVALTT